MILLFASLIALAAAGQPAAPPAQGPTQCRGNDKAVAAWLDAQSKTTDFFSDTPDMWAYANNVLEVSSGSDLWYFSQVDYLCLITPTASGCSSQVQSIEQRCNADGTIEIKAVLQVRNANTWVSVLSNDYVAAQPYPYPQSLVWAASQPIYGCRLNSNKLPSTQYQAQACRATDPNWQQRLALSSGRFTYTYRLTGATCTCSNPDVTTNYAHNILAEFQLDNDVNFQGSGFFNNVTGTGIYQDLTGAGISGTHSIRQTTAGAPIDCSESVGTTCWVATHGMANVKLRPQGGGNMDLLELRKFLNSLFLRPSFSPYTNTYPPAKKSAPLKQEASKK